MTEEVDLRAVRARIAALLTLADPARGGTAAECEVAAEKAQRLAGRHGVDLDEIREDLDRILQGHAPGEQVLEVTGPHAVRALLLLWRLARVLHVTTTPTADGELLTGRRVDVEQLIVVHHAAWPALTAAHARLLEDLRRPGARAARRYLSARWPDPRYQRDVLRQLRYTPPDRLADQIRAEIGGTPVAARAAARALIAGRPSPIDTAPDDVDHAWWSGAIDTIERRIQGLDRIRNPDRPAPTPDAVVDEVLADDHPPPAPVPAPRRRRRPGVDPQALAHLQRHAQTVAAGAPLGLADLTTA